MSTRSRNWKALVLVMALAIAATLATGAAQALPSGQVGSQVQQGSGKDAGAKGDKAEERIQKAIERLNGLKEKKLAAFDKRIEKAKKASEKFASKGLDVTKLNADISALEAMVAGAAKEVDQVIAALKKAESLASGENSEEFKSAAKDALAKAKALKQQIAEVRRYAGSTVKADIKALAQQARKSQKQTKDQK